MDSVPDSAAGRGTCVFAKALLADVAVCECAGRGVLGELVWVECGSPVARTNCQTLSALMRERAQFALRLLPGRPLTHQQALRLECGGIAALTMILGGERRDVHQMVGLAQERHGSLTNLPWVPMVQDMVRWIRPRRGQTRP